jgi:site-specific recombinase XerD
VADAVLKYLAVKQAEGLQPITMAKQKGMMNRLSAFAKSRGLLYLRDVKVDHLQDWRLSWKFKKNADGSLSPSWKVHWCIVSAFFKYAHTLEWVSTNEAAKLKGLKATSLQVQPFTRDEMTAILAAVPKCGWDEAKTKRVSVAEFISATQY